LTQNYFELFNLPEKFQIDSVKLQENYRSIQKEIHPDRFATSTENEKTQSMIKSTQVNDAYQTLKSTTKRAKYILSLHKSVEKITLPPDFLMQQMEWEEHLEDIEKNNKELDQFKLAINKKYKEYSLLLSKQIDNDQNWNEAAITIDKLYFVEKLLHKINIALN
jgi:molecular chaperone HscB|tara:strand:- start:371 stop:862 length:492 start_codon:yes stop_codon:yes gene_type:complete